jgi:hypothetical protein
MAMSFATKPGFNVDRMVAANAAYAKCDSNAYDMMKTQQAGLVHLQCNPLRVP